MMPFAKRLARETTSVGQYIIPIIAVIIKQLSNAWFIQHTAHFRGLKYNQRLQRVFCLSARREHSVSD